MPRQVRGRRTRSPPPELVFVSIMLSNKDFVTCFIPRKSQWTPRFGALVESSLWCSSFTRSPLCLSFLVAEFRRARLLGRERMHALCVKEFRRDRTNIGHQG